MTVSVEVLLNILIYYLMLRLRAAKFVHFFDHKLIKFNKLVARLVIMPSVIKVYFRDMAISSKRGHGRFSTTLLENNIISAKLIGSFNERGCFNYTESVKHIVNALNGEPFAMLIDDLELEGGTPEAYQTLQAYNVWLNTQSIIAKAFIVNDRMTKHIILQRSPALLEQKIAFFETHEEAESWLSLQLYQKCS
ncbi:hypothetical protein MTsN2n4_23050 [Pseudoalteromonas sp. MTN2-4]